MFSPRVVDTPVHDKALNDSGERCFTPIENLPIEVLPELANFVEYLHYKANRRTSVSERTVEENSGSAFLLSIPGIGTSAENDFYQRDEEILASDRVCPP